MRGAEYLNILTQNEYNNIKNIRSNDDIKDAVNLWIKNKESCIERFGHKVNGLLFILQICLIYLKEQILILIYLSGIQEMLPMEEMFSDCKNFNVDINSWITNNVTNMKKII